VKKILITGANSYIGTSFERYLAQWPEQYQVDTVDMVDGSWRGKSFAGYDAVYHVAGIAHSDTGNVTEERKAFYYQINTDLTVEAAKKAKADGTRQFIFMSSAIVYGESAPIGKSKRITRETPVSPANFYGDSKVQAENGILPLNDENFKVVVLRPPMIYGPGSKGNYPVLSKLARKLPVFPAVNNERSMLYIENLMEFVRLMVENEERGIFWPQNGTYSNTTELVKMIAKNRGKSIAVIPGFTWALKLMSHCTGLVNKAFGSLSYDMELSDYPQDYRKCTLEESIKKTEATGAKRALIYASVASMIQQFNMDNIRLLLSMGYEVDVASNMEVGNTITPARVAAMKAELEELGVHVYHMPVPRSPLAVGAIWKSFRMTRKMMKEQNYTLVHCHSPVGGLICRLANRFSGNYRKSRMIYTAHGFHFYEGAPRKNWLIYYPIEKLCSCWTDTLITINHEDYELAKAKMKAQKTEWIPGIGIDLKRFEQLGKSRAEVRAELKIPEDAVVLMSVGELNENKNHRVMIEALGQIGRKDLYYIICGQGVREDEYRACAQELGLSEQLKLLGYRDDIPALYHAADICCFPSIREGLGMGAVEGMACGLPLIVADNRGTRCYATHEENGFVCRYDAVDEFEQAILKLADCVELRRSMGEQNKERVKQFSAEEVCKRMTRIYGESK